MPRTDRNPLPHRRDVLRLGAAAGFGLGVASLVPGMWPAASPRRPRVAAIMTVMTYRSHAHVILENFLQRYLFNGQWTDPGVDVVSFYVDQFPDGDMSRRVAAQYGIPTYETTGDAVRAGGQELGVDAVLSIGEHGDYPYNDRDQHMYPRKRFFDEIVAVFRDSGRAVPVFNDKHLSYRWDWARAMYDTSRELDFGLMAGSSVPLGRAMPGKARGAGPALPEMESAACH